MNPFEYQGYWWLPENAENKYSGTLSFSHEEGLRLETLGSFLLDELEPEGSKSIGVIKQYPVIKGITREGKYFTLFENDSGGLAVRAPGLPSQVFRPNYAFEEEMPNLTRTPPSMFRRARVQFTYLADWIGASGIRQNIVFNKEERKIQRLEFVYEVQDKIVADLGSAKVSIVEGYNSSGTNGDVRGVSLNPHFSLEVKVDQELSLDNWLHQFISPLGDFLTLAVGQPNTVEKLLLYSNENQTDIPDGISKPSPTTIFYRQGMRQRAKLPKTIGIYHMLFSFQDIKQELAPLLQTWFAKRSEFESTMDLFFAVKNSSGMYLNNEFLNLAQALEVYHREKFNTLVMPKNEYNRRKKAIGDSAPEDHRQWLVDQLAYANQPKLYQRLLELAEHTSLVLSKLVTALDVFARKVTDTRNFLTHFSRQSSNVMHGEELYRATQVLSYMLQISVLLELDISEERIVAMFERNQKFLFTAGQIKRAHYWE